MKKQFFYAAMALAVMSSCSNDNDPGTQNPEESTDLVAIQLGVQDASVTATTRGTGSVGDLGEGNNVWSGQKLNVIMVKQGTVEKTTIYENETFNAPTGVQSGLITLESGNIKYYPLQGQFDFFGYHIDTTTDPTETVGTNNITVTATIDGTNDVMAATADLTDTQKGNDTAEGVLGTDDQHRAYSAWAARKSVQPTLTFNHLLSRLKFNVKAGKPEAGTENYTTNTITPHKFPVINDEDVTADGIDITELDQNSTETTDGAVYIHSIKVLNQKANVELTFIPSTVAETTVTRNQPTLAFIDVAENTFTLMSKPENDATDKNLIALAPTAPENTTDNTSVGESVMIEEGQENVELEIILMQYVKTNENGTYGWKAAKMTTTVNAPENETDNNTFAKGKAYNVNITVYGFQQIEITAALTAWESGGNVEVAPEDE